MEVNEENDVYTYFILDKPLEGDWNNETDESLKCDKIAWSLRRWKKSLLGARLSERRWFACKFKQLSESLWWINSTEINKKYTFGFAVHT